MLDQNERVTTDRAKGVVAKYWERKKEWLQDGETRALMESVDVLAAILLRLLAERDELRERMKQLESEGPGT